MLEQEYGVYLADTDEGKNIHYSLRYQVYCLREKYEDPSLHPDFCEQDEFDDISVHFIARAERSGEWVGAMRLVIGPMQKLPVSKFALTNAADSSGILPNFRGHVAEASRLCAMFPRAPRSNFVSQPSDMAYRPSRSRNDKGLETSWITLVLIRAARQYCLEHEIAYGFFLVSDPLARILQRLGIAIDPVGSPCQHRGWRRPYIHNIKTGYRAMRTRSPELYRIFSEGRAYVRYSDSGVESDAAPIAAAIG